MNIALFADVHGRVLLTFLLCARWEQETGKKIDYILQAGDLGAFPDRSRLDKATRRFAEKDPSELGFSEHFTAYDPEVARLLERTTCPLIFVRGNHEDHPWLDTLEKQASEPIFSVDYYQRIWCLKTGHPYTIQKDEESLTVLGIGRVGEREGEASMSKRTYSSRDDTYIQAYERQNLDLLSTKNVDVLLTHDSQEGGFFANSGMREISEALILFEPRYHFYGHYGGPCLRTEEENLTICKLADLHWDHRTGSQRLDAGSMAILTWQNRTQHTLQLVEEPWLYEYAPTNWHAL